MFMQEIGVGVTTEFSLRVSAAALVRVTFAHPASGKAMLALEQKATLLQAGDRESVNVVAQPFGGGSRLNRPAALLEHIPGFHFDSARVKAEQDFRILIRPQDWEPVKRFCQQHFIAGDGDVLENDPARELSEEFADALGFELKPAHYRLRPLGLLAENHPAATENVHAAHLPTVRIYTLFAADLLDPFLIGLILARSAGLRPSDLEHLARQDALRGGKGRANSALALPLDALAGHYRSLSPLQRGEPATFAGRLLSGNVPALLDDLSIPKYERLPPR